MTNKIDLSNLELKEIEEISEKPLIILFDGNKITRIDKLALQSQLQQLSIGKNQIIQMNGLSNLINLTVLNLPYNNIISIDGLKTLTRLTWLNLSNNRIKIVEHLESNLQLKHLDLSDNLILKFSKISFLGKLKTFLLHGNNLSTLVNCESFLPSSIEILSLAENRIHDLTEIYHLASLQNLKQLSIKENPCIHKEDKDNRFDYRPYIINWCLNLKILDGEEISEKEKLVAEWLYTQGKGRSFKPGQHFDLVHYLVNECALTNSKNKWKLNNDLDNILKQRRQHSSRRNYVYCRDLQTSNETISDTCSPRLVDTSYNISDIDLNQSFSFHGDPHSVTNSSMLISESSFLPVSPSNQNVISPASKLSSPSKTTNNSTFSESPSVPTIRYSVEVPKISRKSTNLSILDQSFDHSSLICSSSMINRDEQCKDIQSTMVQLQSNNSSFNNRNSPKISLDCVIRIQAWWRGIFTRSKNPIVKKYLNTRESQRTRSHILFLQRQMQLYYESYEQQRKLNAAQSQAIAFLIDQMREIGEWKERTIQTQNMTEPFQLKTFTDSFTEPQTEVKSIENQSLLDKVDDLQDQVINLKETVRKLEHTVLNTCMSGDKRAYGASEEHSDYSFSDESDLNKMICEVEKILDPKFADSLSGTMSKSFNSVTNEDDLDTLKTDQNMN